MNYLDFRERFIEPGCFSTNQVLACYPTFQRNNLTRWCAKGLLVKLRQGYYAFAERLSKPGFLYYISNYIYKPSYISTHSALAFYGIIPEAVAQLTAATSLKTQSFTNSAGHFVYQRIKPQLLFGYEQKSGAPYSFAIALPEKALLDLLYLYPAYQTAEDMDDLRLDADFMQTELDAERLQNFTQRFGSKQLNRRIEILRSIYG